MLRPATPLSILLFVSFVLLLISVISTPIVRGIPLARYQNVNFGVFGWCKDDGTCSPITVGWNTDGALPSNDDAAFNLPSSTRHSLSSLLIVHPVAAFCNLIVLGLAIAAHFHSPSHSARYLLGLLILLLPTLLVTLLAFLVDILLFVPHLHWGGWIVLASTILITASGVVTCAMRRTLVSRKARKKRIAENAEMSGANFYARQAEETRMVQLPSTESKMPMVQGAPGADNLPVFASYSGRRSEDHPTTVTTPSDPVSMTPLINNRYYEGQRSRSQSRPRQDEFGAPIGQRPSYEDRPPMPPNVNRGGYGPPRGRGYPPRGRGYGPLRGRGGYPHPPGIMIPPGQRPPPGYGPQGPERYGPPSDPRYGPISPISPSNYSQDGQQGLAYGARARSPSQPRRSPYSSRAQSPAGGMPSQEMPPPMPPMPIGEQYRSPVHQRTLTGADSDALGPMERHRIKPQTPPMSDMSGPEQFRVPVHNRAVTGADPEILGMNEMQRAEPHHSRQVSAGSQPEYIPARAEWSDNTQRSPINRKRVGSGRTSRSSYVEDVDPRFADQPSAPPPEAFDLPPQQNQQVPGLLRPGRNPQDPSPESSVSRIAIPRNGSYDELHPGARSPVDSEVSNFTSVSQRPMNPNWQPGHGGEFNSFGAQPDRRLQQRQDVLFANNPDFELPGMSGSRGRGGYRGRGGMGPSSYRGPMRPPPPSVLDNMGADGRYPAPGPPAGSQMGPGGGVMREI